MYKDSSFYCTVSRENNDIKKLRVNRDIQEKLVEIFSEKSEELLDDSIEYIEFDGRYKPGKNEILYIKDFNLPESIKKAVETPTSTEELRPKDNKNEKINAIFTGKKCDQNGYNVAFQNILPNQIITSAGFGLIFSNNSFNKINNLALSIKEQVDCVYKNNNLYFSSYWVARQIFDLADYYEIATDGELSNFIKRDVLSTENESSFFENADTWVRRKVALIEDGKVLEKYSPYEIKKIAEEHDVDLNIIEDEKILVPEDKRELKELLRFLDEDIYKGPFSNNTYVTNSKRKM